MFLLVGLALPLTAAGALPGSLEALVAPSAPTQALGELIPTGGHFAVRAQLASDTPIFEAAKAVIVLYRDTVPALPSVRPGEAEEVSPGSIFSQETEAKNARITLVRVEPRVVLEADLEGLTGVNATFASDGCALVPRLYVPPSGALEPRPALGVTCDAGGVRLSEPAAVHLYGNATLRLEYEDDGDAVTQEIHLRTGASDVFTMADSWDGMRVAVPTPDLPGAAWNLERAENMSFVTPLLALAGHLRLPEADGRLIWADQELGPKVPEMEVRGTFLIASPSDRFLDIRGIAFHEPASQAPVAARGDPSAAVLVTGGMGALALLALLLRGPFQLLFTRLSTDRALDHERRAAIVEAVASQPGLRLHDLARLVGMHKSVAGYHMRVLEKQGILVVAHWGRHTALFLRNRHPPALQQQLIHLRRRWVPELLERLRAEPTMRQLDLARELGVSRFRIAVLVKELEQAGLLRRSRAPEGRTHYHVAPLEDLGVTPA